MSRAPHADLASLLPHLADLPQRLTDMLPLLAQAHARQGPRIAEMNRAFLARMTQLAPDPGAAHDTADPRSLPYFAHLRALHALQTEWSERYIDTLDLRADQAGRLRFALHQWQEARNPDNFIATNPEVLREALASGGDSLLRGQHNLQADLSRGRVTMSDATAFAVGRNLAITAGAVIFENPLIQLIRYRPLTRQVNRTPLLVVPPFINKYYILDLQAHNSFVRHALEQGLQVFMISWRNISPAQGDLTWDDYAASGIAAALEATLALTRAPWAHTLGFCVGGTLLASSLASCVPATRVSSLTLLASLLDFSEVGDIGHYIDDAFIRRCEDMYANGGIVPGAQLAAAFASLRPRELQWRFVIGNYLLGRTPPAFDLLHWNSDSANLPGPLFTWYARELYLHDRLRHAESVMIREKPVNLQTLNMPAFILGTELDHIVPWRSAYASTRLLGGPRQFVLGSSGHIAGVVSPPTDSRRSYRVAEDTPADAEAWLARSEKRPGSWWPYWTAWLKALDPTLRNAPRNLGNRAHPVIEEAPGRYVTEIPA